MLVQLLAVLLVLNVLAQEVEAGGYIRVRRHFCIKFCVLHVQLATGMQGQVQTTNLPSSEGEGLV